MDLPYNARYSAAKYPCAEFGVIGGFPWDADLEREIEWCRQAFASPSTPKPPMSRLVALLSSLPLKGRHAVVRKIIAPSPHREAILRDLFDFCFQPGGDGIDNDDDNDAMIVDDDDASSSTMVDEEFVLIANPTAASPGAAAPKPLNLNRHHIFQAVIVLMAMSGNAGVEASRLYLQSASTRYRAKILIQCATTHTKDQFSNEDLWKAHQSSPNSVKQSVVEACKQSGGRKDFLRQVYEQDGDSSLIYWLQSDYLASTLAKADPKKTSIQLKRWGVHGDVYIEFIRQRLEACKDDCLKLGETWSNLEPTIETNSIRPSHVEALLEMFDRLKPYKVKGSSNHGTKTFLQDLSKKGEDITSFEEVERMLLPQRLLKHLTKQGKRKLVLESFENQDLEAFQWYKGLLSSHELPYKESFAKATLDDLYGISADPFANKIINSIGWDVMHAKELSRRLDYVKARSGWILRCKPSQLSDHQLSQLPDSDIFRLWKNWYGWYNVFVDSIGGGIASVIRSEHGSRFLRLNSSKLNQHVLYLHELLNVAKTGMEEAKDYLETKALLEPIIKLLRLFPHNLTTTSDNDDAEEKAALKNLDNYVVDLIVGEVIPRLESYLQFDPSDHATYITNGKLQFFENSCSFFLKSKWLVSSEKLGGRVASMLLDVLSRASKYIDDGTTTTAAKLPKYIISTDVKTSKRRLVHLDTYLNGRARSTCLSQMENMLHATKGHYFHENLWVTVIKEVCRDDTAKYLSKCISCLPDDQVKAKKHFIISQSRDFINDKYREDPYHWEYKLAGVLRDLTKLGVLEKVLEDVEVPENIKDSMLRDYADFSNENVQKFLKDATFDPKGGEKRAEAIIALLEKACATKSLSLIAEALSFAASRIKNESGVHRRAVFKWFGNNFVDRVVSQSLQDKSSPSSVHDRLSSVIIAIQKNDFARLDCVGRMECFPHLPSSMLYTVLKFDPKVLNLERRQLWCNTATRLHWTFHQAQNGEESLHCFDWPFGSFELPSATWVSPEAVKAAYPPKGNSEKFSCLKEEGLLLSDKMESDKDQVFGPKQCIDVLEKSVEGLWGEDFPCSHLQSSFPEDEVVAAALLNRIKKLLGLCGTAWQEVGSLTTIVDTVFGNIESASDQQFSDTVDLFLTLAGIHQKAHCYRDDVSCAMQVPRLAKACDAIFRNMMVRSESVVSGSIPEIFLYWKALYLEYDDQKWNSISDDRLKHFLMKTSNNKCAPSGSTLTKNDEVLRKCVMIRELLTMSKSAFWVAGVLDIIFAHREDVFSKYDSDNASLEGPLTPLSDFEQCDNIDSLLYNYMEPDSLKGCSAAVCRRYTATALKEATNHQCDLLSKIKAIKKFMGTPTTQHNVVIEALQSDLEDAVREVLMNRIFELDSPWHILGVLLSQSSLKKNDQRVTAALLGYVSQHVHVSKVVDVLEILLKNPRRKNLSLQLHKAAIRMLFDAKTDASQRLLRTEWDNSELPVSVRNLIVEKCIRAVISGKVDEWEATVLLRVAQDVSLEVDTKFLLFAPRFSSSEHLTIPQADNCEKDELLEQFREKGPSSVSFPSGDMRIADKFYSICEELERVSEGALKVLAKCKKLSFARIFGPKHTNDQGALDEMLHVLTTAQLNPNHQSQFELSYVSALFATAVCDTLKHTLLKEKAHEKSRKEVADILNKSDVANKFKECVRAQLKEVLDLSIRDIMGRKHQIQSLSTLLNTIRRESHINKALVEPIKSELELLGKVKSVLNDVR